MPEEPEKTNIYSSFLKTESDKAAARKQASKDALKKFDEQYGVWEKEQDPKVKDGFLGPKIQLLAQKLNKYVPPLGLNVSVLKQAREEEAKLLKENYKKDKSSYDERVTTATNAGIVRNSVKWEQTVGKEPVDLLSRNLDSILEAEKAWNARIIAFKKRLADAKTKGLVTGSQDWATFVGPEPKKYQTESIVNGAVTGKDIEGAAESLEQLGSEPLSYDEAARRIGLGFLTEDTDIFEDLGSLLDNLETKFPVVTDILADLEAVAEKIEKAIKAKIAAVEDNIKMALSLIKDTLAAYWNEIMLWIKNWIMGQLMKHPVDAQKIAMYIAVKKIKNDIDSIKMIIEVVLERTQQYILFVTYLADALIKKFVLTLERVESSVNKITEQIDRKMKVYGDEMQNIVENAKGIVSSAAKFKKELIGAKEEAIANFKNAAKTII